MDMHGLSLILELKLLFWVLLGSIVGLIVELNTGKADESSVLFHSNLSATTTKLSNRVLILIVNVLVGASIAYVATPFVSKFLHLDPKDYPTSTTGFLMGVAGLSLAKGYVTAMRQRTKISNFIFKVIDLFREK